jgi:hypothetical protein
MCDDAFLNLLSQMIGVQGIPLHYVVRDANPPDQLENEAEEHMYQVPLDGNAYTEDSKTVYLKLKQYLIKMDGWAWIANFDRSQDG